MSYPFHTNYICASTCEAINEEREKQVDKFGQQDNLTDSESLLIIAEEFGEVAKEICSVNLGTAEEKNINKNDYKKKLRKEVLQLITVSVAFYERIVKEA